MVELFAAVSGKGKNLLHGITPTAADFDTPPSSLGNCTDGNTTTVTGTGQSVEGGAGTCGRIIFDLGSVKSFIVGAKLGIWASTNNIIVSLDTSDDGNTWNYNNVTLQSNGGNNSEQVVEIVPMMVLGKRYFQLRFRSAAAQTAYVKLYEVAAIELGL